MKKPPYLRVEFWSAVGLVLFFFLPWVSYAGLFSMTGYQVGDAFRAAASNEYGKYQKMDRVGSEPQASRGFYSASPPSAEQVSA